MTSKWLKFWYNFIYYTSFMVIYIAISVALTFFIFKIFKLLPKDSKYIFISIIGFCNVVSYCLLSFTLYRSQRMVKMYSNITFSSFNKFTTPPFKYDNLIVTINKPYLALNAKITIKFWNIGIPCDKIVNSDEIYIYSITRKRISKLEEEDILYRDLYIKSVAIDCRTFRTPINFQNCTVVKIDTKPPLFYIQGYGAFIL